jgi:hypothetical protein
VGAVGLALEEMNLAYPSVDAGRLAELQQARQALEAEVGAGGVRKGRR